jgi:uncharacterized protein (DUF58 family)
MLPTEILRKVRRIEIITKRLVNDVFAGEYHSVFKGRGIEFAEVREYTPGDDVRTIDWNVTARMRRPYVKRYMEERELTVMLLVDMSGSLRFGSGEQFKSEILAEICSLLAFSAIRNHDKVGLLLFTDRIEKYVRPQKGRKHVLRVIREALYYQPQGRRTDLQRALEYLGHVLRRRAVVFLLSDFRDRGYERALTVANRKHDVVAVTVTDPREEELPPAGLVELQEAETGEVLLIDSSSRRWREAFAAQVAAERQHRAQTLAHARVDAIHVRCGESYVKPFVRFFDERAKRFRR